MTLKFSAGFGAGSGATIADDSGGSHPLAVVSGSYSASGHTGPGFQNATGTSSTGASGVVGAITGTACTLMAWVKPLALAAGGTHLIAGAMQAGGSTDFALYTQRGDFGTPNVLQGNVRVGGLVAVNGAALTVGTWAHVALTYDGANLRLYKDGALVTTVANAGTIANSATLFVAGMAVSPLTGNVLVDDVRYFDDVQSLAQIGTLMSTPVGATGRTVSIGQAVETDTAQPVTRKRSRTIGQATETDLAQPVTRRRTRVLGQAAETDLAQAVTRIRKRPVGQASETDIAQLVSRTRRRSVAQAVETDSAQAVTHRRVRSMGQAIESDLAQAVSVVRARFVQLGQAIETSTAMALVLRKARGIAQAVEVDSALAVTRRRARGLNQAVESDIAGSLLLRRTVRLVQAVELDLALAVHPAGEAGPWPPHFGPAHVVVRARAGTPTEQAVVLVGDAVVRNVAVVVGLPRVLT